MFGFYGVILGYWGYTGVNYGFYGGLIGACHVGLLGLQVPPELEAMKRWVRLRWTVSVTLLKKVFARPGTS